MGRPEFAVICGVELPVSGVCSNSSLLGNPVFNLWNMKPTQVVKLKTEFNFGHPHGAIVVERRQP